MHRHLNVKYSRNFVRECNHLEIFVSILHKQEQLALQKNRSEYINLDPIPDDITRTKMTVVRH